MKYFITALERVPNTLPACIIINYTFPGLISPLLLFFRQPEYRLQSGPLGKCQPLSCHNSHDSQSKILRERGKPAYHTDIVFCFLFSIWRARDFELPNPSEQVFSYLANLPRITACGLCHELDLLKMADLCVRNLWVLASISSYWHVIKVSITKSS